VIEPLCKDYKDKLKKIQPIVSDQKHTPYYDFTEESGIFTRIHLTFARPVFMLWRIDLTLLFY
jgi:hypothetical protein